MYLALQGAGGLKTLSLKGLYHSYQEKLGTLDFIAEVLCSFPHCTENQNTLEFKWHLYLNSDSHMHQLAYNSRTGGPVSWPKTGTSLQGSTDLENFSHFPINTTKMGN